MQIWRGSGSGLDGVGVAASLAAAVAFAAYILMAEHGVKRRDSISLTRTGSSSALFFAVIQPWWTFPTEHVSQHVSLLGHLSNSTCPSGP